MTRDPSPNCWLLWSSGEDSPSVKLRSGFQPLLAAACCKLPLTAMSVRNQGDEKGQEMEQGRPQLHLSYSLDPPLPTKLSRNEKAKKGLGDPGGSEVRI